MGKRDYLVTTGRYEGKRSRRKPRETLLYSLTSRHVEEGGGVERLAVIEIKMNLHENVIEIKIEPA